MFSSFLLMTRHQVDPAQAATRPASLLRCVSLTCCLLGLLLVILFLGLLCAWPDRGVLPCKPNLSGWEQGRLLSSPGTGRCRISFSETVPLDVS